MEKGSLAEGWVKNGSIKLHYIDNQGGAGPTPLVVVPGFTSPAEDFSEIARSLFPRRCVCLSLRGRGKSDTPSSGYSLNDHAGDVASLVTGIGLEGACFMAHSRGVPYAIAFAKTHDESVIGLILLDYPARHSKPSPDWADSFLQSDYGKSAIPSKVRLQTVRGLQAESGGELLWEALEEFDFPVLVMRGGAEGHLLKDEDANLYTKYLKHGRLLVFEESGHDMWKPDLGKFIRVLEDFLGFLDRRAGEKEESV